MRYYIDACIWRDFYENRKDSKKKLGALAKAFLKQVISRNDVVFYSDFLLLELSFDYTEADISSLFSYIPQKLLIEASMTKQDVDEAQLISSKYRAPFGDTLHAVLAQKYHAVLVTRDRHFKRLREVVVCKKPEELS